MPVKTLATGTNVNFLDRLYKKLGNNRLICSSLQLAQQLDLRRYCPSDHHGGSRFCISLLTFTSLAKKDGEQVNVFFVLLISSGHVLKQDVVNVYGMNRCHNPGLQHLSCAVHIINALYPLSYYAMTNTCPFLALACLQHFNSMHVCRYIVVTKHNQIGCSRRQAWSKVGVINDMNTCRLTCSQASSGLMTLMKT